MQLLGNTIAEIAEQKAGIIKPGVPVVVSRQPFPAAAEIVERRAGELHAPVFRPVAPSPSFQAILNPLPDFARDDFRNALTVMQVLGLAPDATAYQAPLLRGRFECVRTNPLVILDVAHNADSAQRLVEALREFYPATTFCVVLGIVKGKDVPGIFHALLPVAAEFILTNPRTDKGSELPQLHALATASGKPFRVIPEITDAADLPSCKPLLFTGSFFTALIGEMLYL
jgi:dihydrofolate synthase/folylpolyglutamate synthase